MSKSKRAKKHSQQKQKKGGKDVKPNRHIVLALMQQAEQESGK